MDERRQGRCGAQTWRCSVCFDKQRVHWNKSRGASHTMICAQNFLLLTRNLFLLVKMFVRDFSGVNISGLTDPAFLD